MINGNWNSDLLLMVQQSTVGTVEKKTETCLFHVGPALAEIKLFKQKF